MIPNILSYAKDSLFNPGKIYDKSKNKNVVDVIIYIVSISVFVFMLQYLLSILLNKTQLITIKHAFVLIFINLFIWFSLSLFVMLPLTIFMRIRMTEDKKIYFKSNPHDAMKWINKQWRKNFKVMGYSITPILIFAPLSLILSPYIFYLSWYWIVLGTIGFSKAFKVSKVEAFVSLAIAYILAIILFWQPFREVMMF